MPIYGPWNREERARMFLKKPLFPQHTCYVGMNSFGFTRSAQSPPAHPMIFTYDAGPCIIIAMTNRAGIGALGHFGGEDRADPIVQGVAKMRAAIGGSIAHLIFSAGSEIQPAVWEDILARSGEITGTMPIHLTPNNPKAGVYGAAALFPRDQALLVYADFKDENSEIMELTDPLYDATLFEKWVY